MDGKQLCGIRDISSPATLSYVIVLQIRGKKLPLTLYLLFYVKSRQSQITIRKL